MLVNYIIGERESVVTGVSRYRDMIYSNLKDKVDFNVIDFKAKPLIAPLQRYFTYPIMAKRKLRDGPVHITANQHAYLLNKIKGKHTVVTVHNVFNIYVLKDSVLRRELRQNQGSLSDWLFAYETGMWAKALRKAEVVLADSKFTRSEVIKYLGCRPDQVRVVYLGVDSQRFKPLHKFQKPACFSGKTILHIGAATLRENPVALAKAFANLKEKIPDVKMVKIGSFDSRFLELITKLGVAKDVVSVTNIPEKDLPIFYNSADLLFFPSIYEEFGLPPLEAMACGLPVVASNTSSIPEVVGDAAITKNPADAVGFAEAMYSVLTDNRVRRKLIRRGLRRAGQLSWKKTAEETLKLYEEVYPGKS